MTDRNEMLDVFLEEPEFNHKQRLVELREQLAEYGLRDPTSVLKFPSAVHFTWRCTTQSDSLHIVVGLQCGAYWHLQSRSQSRRIDSIDFEWVKLPKRFRTNLKNWFS